MSNTATGSWDFSTDVFPSSTDISLRTNNSESESDKPKPIVVARLDLSKSSTLSTFINRNLWVNGTGLVLSLIGLVLSIVAREVWLIILTGGLILVFVDMLITVLVDKLTSR